MVVSDTEPGRIVDAGSDDRQPDEAEPDIQSLLERGVVRDFVDLRDEIYKPSLGRLQARQHLPDGLFLDQAEIAGNDSGSLAARRLAFGIRNQGKTGRCTGYALAALVDIQRRLQDPNGLHDLGRAHEQVSADMLYYMARFHDEFDRREAAEAGPSALEATSGSEGVRTLRSVIKGLYHHGVCLDLVPGECPADPFERWQSSCHAGGEVFELHGGEQYPTVAQAKAARMITLGAYYRLRPILNDYHAALNETGTILVSAHIHKGWSFDALNKTSGRIDWTELQQPAGSHAFVLVGYNQDGFLVLNSWGEQWGQFEGVGGVALWPYADWASNIIDGWVLRLGVSAPGAFDVSVGEQGSSKVFDRIRAGSTPYLELMGHFAHLDDGRYVERGAYPYTLSIMNATFDYLGEQMSGEQEMLAGKGKLAHPKKKARQPALANHPQASEQSYKGIVLWMPASLEGMKATYEQAVQHKKRLKDLGLYPYNIFWCSDFVEDAMKTLADVFEKCESRAGDDAEHLDQLIEMSVRGVGRAFWRDVKVSARRAVIGPDTPDLGALPDGFGADQLGAVSLLFSRCLDLGYRKGSQIHIVTEGAGALLLDELLRVFTNPEVHQRSPQIAEIWKRGRHAIRSVNISLPTIGSDRAMPYLLRLVQDLNKRSLDNRRLTPQYAVDLLSKPDTSADPAKRSKSSGATPPARIYLPTKRLEKRLKVAQYGQSISHLVANAFEDQGQNGRRVSNGSVLGMSGAYNVVAPIDRPERTALRSAFTEIAGDWLDGDAKVEQVQLARDPVLRAEIYRTIQQHSKSNRNFEQQWPFRI